MSGLFRTSYLIIRSMSYLRKASMPSFSKDRRQTRKYIFTITMTTSTSSRQWQDFTIEDIFVLNAIKGTTTKKNMHVTMYVTVVTKSTKTMSSTGNTANTATDTLSTELASINMLKHRHTDSRRAKNIIVAVIVLKRSTRSYININTFVEKSIAPFAKHT